MVLLVPHTNYPWLLRDLMVDPGSSPGFGGSSVRANCRVKGQMVDIIIGCTDRQICKAGMNHLLLRPVLQSLGA
jgi:hypothetical protein